MNQTETDADDIINYLEFLKKLLVETPPPPCVECPFHNSCRDKNEACYDFYTYVRYEKFKPLRVTSNNGYGKKYSRHPSFKWYRTVFILPKLNKEID